jgi:nitrogen fixation-related uncharacterized protein
MKKNDLLTLFLVTVAIVAIGFAFYWGLKMYD